MSGTSAVTAAAALTRPKPYFSFSTGHELAVTGDVVERASETPVALGMEPRGSVRSAAAHGWRATWTDLASRPRRLAARALDLTVVGALGAVGWTLPTLIGLPSWFVAVIALLLIIGYEPVSAITGGSPGKRLARIEPISTWNGRTLGRADTLRRALFVDVQFLFPPLAVRNLAWLLWDPARQCLHDRRAASIVTAGRSRPGQKV